jgi:hypothetical protein
MVMEDYTGLNCGTNIMLHDGPSILPTLDVCKQCLHPKQLILQSRQFVDWSIVPDFSSPTKKYFFFFNP